MYLWHLTIRTCLLNVFLNIYTDSNFFPFPLSPFRVVAVIDPVCEYASRMRNSEPYIQLASMGLFSPSYWSALDHLKEEGKWEGEIIIISVYT